MRKNTPCYFSVLRAIAAAAAIVSFPSWAETITGRVVGVSDGDTLTLLVDDAQVKVRLAEIDAPEKAQPFGQKSKQSLSTLCFQHQATIDVQDTDRYGRSVARVNCDGVNANAEQVRTGMAWCYTQFLRDERCPAIEEVARAKVTGLWADEDPVAPWIWRKASKSENRPDLIPATGG